MLDNIAFWLVCLMGRVASAILCNFSTYIDSNGDPVRVDDVTVAPLHFKADVAPADNLTADIDFDPSQDEVFYLDESTLTTPSENDRWFELYDSATTSQIRIVWNSTRIAVFAVTPTTSVISGFDNSFILNQFQEIGFKLSGDGNNKSVVCVVDGVESTDVEFIDFTGVTFDKIIVGSLRDKSDVPNFLLNRICSTQLGECDVKSNKDDGLTFISDIGTVYTGEDNSPEDMQIESDGTSTGYQWPESIKELIPQTGGVNLVNDVLQTQWADIDYGQQLPEINVVMTLPYVPYESSVTLFELEHGSTTNNYIRFQRVSETQYRLEVREGNDNYGTSTITSILHDERIHLKIMFVDNTMKMYQNGIKIIDTWFNTTVLPTNTWLMNRWAIGGQYYNFGNKQMMVDYFEIPQVDRWDVSKQRMVSESETPLTSFIGLDNGKEVTFTQKTPHNALFPYELSSSTDYLKEDKQEINGACVTIPAGQELVIDAVTKEYETKNGAYVLKDIP